MRAHQIVRIIVLAIAGLLIAFGVFSLIFSWSSFWELCQWREARPLDVEVDLSQPGEFSYQFILECPYAYSCDLLLILPPSLSGESKPDDLLAGLEACYSIMDSYGLELPHLRELHLEPLTAASGEPILLEAIGRLPEDTYTFRLTVSQGAGALSGVKQRLIMTYAVGFHALGPFMALALGVFALVGGAILIKKKPDTRQGTHPAAAADGTE